MPPLSPNLRRLQNRGAKVTMVNRLPKAASGSEAAPLSSALPVQPNAPTPPVYSPMPAYTGNIPVFGAPDYDSYIRSVAQPDVGTMTGPRRTLTTGGGGGAEYKNPSIAPSTIDFDSINSMRRLLYGPADAPPPASANQGYNPNALSYNPALPGGYGAPSSGPTSLGPATPIVGGFKFDPENLATRGPSQGIFARDSTPEQRAKGDTPMRNSQDEFVTYGPWNLPRTEDAYYWNG